MRLFLSLLLGLGFLGWAIYQQRQKELREAPDRLARLRAICRKDAA